MKLKTPAARRRLARDNLARMLDKKELVHRLAVYEGSGDHDHGRGSVPIGVSCPGGDCLVATARRVIEAMEDVSSRGAATEKLYRAALLAHDEVARTLAGTSDSPKRLLFVHASLSAALDLIEEFLTAAALAAADEEVARLRAGVPEP